jgi:hypothetical protein
MHQIILVGAGQIGSRHLQALAKLQSHCRITVIDPSKKSLEITKSRFLEVANSSPEVSFSTEMPTRRSYDIAIIATNANVRFDVFKQLIADNKIKNIIFEKVLFQTIYHLQCTATILDQRSILAWVNCPRRGVEVYKKLKQTLQSQLPLKMKVDGHNYGLACNGIHFIDLFVFLNGESDIEMTPHQLCETYVEAKRPGCFEVFGTLGATAKKNVLVLQCDSSAEQTSMEIVIETSQNIYVINELIQQIKVYSAAGELLVTDEFVVPPQSEMTHLVVEDILSKGRCELPYYVESANYHEHFITTMLDYFNTNRDKVLLACPIT